MGFIPHLGFTYPTKRLITSVWDKSLYPLAGYWISHITSITFDSHGKTDLAWIHAKRYTIKVDDYSHFFFCFFLRDQNGQHFNEELLAVKVAYY